MLQERKAVHIVISKPCSDSQDTVTRTWRKPMIENVKCNTDASFQSNSNINGIGIQLGPVKFELDLKRVFESFHSMVQDY
jgi:hypothetical protein